MPLVRRPGRPRAVSMTGRARGRAVFAFVMEPEGSPLRKRVAPAQCFGLLHIHPYPSATFVPSILPGFVWFLAFAFASEQGLRSCEA